MARCLRNGVITVLSFAGLVKKCSQCFSIVENPPQHLLSKKQVRQWIRQTYKHVPDVSVEHVVPQSWYARTKPPGVGANASRDLHNLMGLPTPINIHRQAYKFSSRELLPDEAWIYTGLPGYESWKNVRSSLFEPRPEDRGRIARKIMYFQRTYPTVYQCPVIHSESLLQEWNEMHPVDDFERYIDDEIYRIQGNRNPFLQSCPMGRRKCHLPYVPQYIIPGW